MQESQSSLVVLSIYFYTCDVDRGLHGIRSTLGQSKTVDCNDVRREHLRRLYERKFMTQPVCLQAYK